MSEYEENEQYLKKQAEMMTATYSTDGYSGVLNEGTTIAHAEDEENAQYFVDELLGLHEQLATAHAAREAAEAKLDKLNNESLSTIAALLADKVRLQEALNEIALLAPGLKPTYETHEVLPIAVNMWNAGVIAVKALTGIYVSEATPPPATESARSGEWVADIWNQVQGSWIVYHTSDMHPRLKGRPQHMIERTELFTGNFAQREAQRRANELNANES